MSLERESLRHQYLTKFQSENHPSDLFGGNIEIVGTKIVELMKKEDLTHEQADASLQYAYNLIRYESNFLKLK